MSYEGLIFDLDGTLWNCAKASADGFNLAFEKFGINYRVTKEFVESISGNTASEFNEKLLANVPHELRKDIIKYLDDYELSAVKEYAPYALYSNVVEGINSLKLQYKLFIVSNCTIPYLGIFLDRTPVGKVFTDSECYGRTEKPKFENIKSIIERNNLKSACYIGDTAWDEDAAKKKPMLLSFMLVMDLESLLKIL